MVIIMSTIKKIGLILLIATILIWSLYSLNFNNYIIDDESIMSFTKKTVSSDSSNFIKRINFLEEQVEKNSIQQEILIKSLAKLLKQNEKSRDIQKTINHKDKVNDDFTSTTTLIYDSLEDRAKIERHYFDKVKTDFEMEQKNDNWSINEEQHLRTVLQQEDLKFEAINNIDCRSKTCRADISHKNRVNAENFLDVFVRSVHNTAGELEFVTEADGGITTVLYLTPNQ